MDRDLRDKIYLVSGILFVIFSIGMYFSVESYINYFSLADKFRFSFKTSAFLFIIPAIFYFIYLLVSASIKNRAMGGNQNLMIFFFIVFILGAFFSFFFSNYVEKDLLSKGYFICEKNTFAESNLYVKLLKMCN